MSALREATSCSAGCRQHRAGHGAGLPAGRAWHSRASLGPGRRAVIPSAPLVSAGTRGRELVGPRLRVTRGKRPLIPLPAPRPSEANSGGYRWKTHFQPSPPVAPRSLEKSRDSSLHSEGCGRFLSCRMSFFFFFLAFKKHGENIKIVFWLFCQTAFGSAVSRRSGARSRLPSVGAARRWQVAAVGAGSARGMGLQGAAVPRAVLCHSGFCGVPRTAAEPIRLRAPFPGGWQHGLGGFLFSCTELPEHGAAQSPGDATSTWARRWAAPASLAGAPTVAVGRVEAEPVQAGLPCRNPAVEAALQSINQ